MLAAGRPGLLGWVSGWAIATGCVHASEDGDDLALQEASAEKIAASRCRQKVDCGCKVASFEACKAELADEFATLSEGARAIGLVFARECADAIVEANASFGCGTKEDLASLECRICKLYVGDRERGETCREDENLLFDDCVQGLACIGGVCDDPCETVPEGGSCLGKPCEAGLDCELRFDETGEIVAQCVRRPVSGEPCGEAKTCATGLVCDATLEPPTCSAPPALGDPCTDVCEGTAWCDGETCQPLKPDGAPCEQGQTCRSGHCDEGVCVSAPPFVCQT